MSIKLVLVRHAQAENSAGNPDYDRDLTAEGQRDARHIGRWISGQFNNIDTIITSSAKRAKLTAEIISEELKQNQVIESSNEVYEASVRTLLETINTINTECKSALLVAHNPSISYLAEYLTGSPLSGMTPGSAVIIEFNVKEWVDIKKANGKLKIYQIPESI